MNRPVSAEYQKLLEYEQEYERQNNRNEEILKLAQMIMELADLFSQLNVLIEEQGELIDRIDHHIAQALEHTKKGTKELMAAKKHQDKNIATKNIIGLSVVVAGLATGLGLKQVLQVNIRKRERKWIEMDWWRLNITIFHLMKIKLDMRVCGIYRMLLNDVRAGFVAYENGYGQFTSLFKFIKSDLNNRSDSTIIREKLADPNIIPLTINGFFDNYYKEIAEAKNDDDKLTAIVFLCKKFEMAHFFADANQRTIVFVLLNKLLIENGFSPTILDDPFVFDGYKSKAELVIEVKKGQEYFKECSQKYSKIQKASETIAQSSTLFQKAEQKNSDKKDELPPTSARP